MPLRLEGIVGEELTPASVEADIAAYDGDTLDIILTSPGGSAVMGSTIYAALRRDARPVSIVIEGIAASAGSLIAMAGDDIAIDDAALLMIHDPAMLAAGTAADLSKSANTLDKMAQTYAQVYAKRSGNSVEDVRAWMIEETWLDASEAVALGFADRVVEMEDAPQMAALAVDDEQGGAHLAVQLFKAMRKESF